MSDQLRIDVKVDSTRLIRRLKHSETRLAIAAVNAINKTAKHIQREMRELVEERFTIRRPDFMGRMAAVIKPFASVKEARPYAVISVGEKPRLLLSKYERGAERRPATPGAHVLAVPVIGGPARPTFASSVPQELQMKRLRFDRTKTGKVRAGASKTGTFLIPERGIFQRLPGQDPQPVYSFVRTMRIPKMLGWRTRAQALAQRWFPEYFEREVIKAIERSKGGGL